MKKVVESESAPKVDFEKGTSSEVSSANGHDAQNLTVPEGETHPARDELGRRDPWVRLLRENESGARPYRSWVCDPISCTGRGLKLLPDSSERRNGGILPPPNFKGSLWHLDLPRAERMVWFQISLN